MDRRSARGVCATLLAALASALGCGAEPAEREGQAPAARPPGEPTPAGERSPGPAATPPQAPGPAPEVGLRRAEALRRARAALSPEERRALWRKRLGVPDDPDARQRLREVAEARDRALVPQLDASDAAVRLEAVREVDLQGPGRERVFALVRDDPDPAVRAAALERLYEEPAPTARQVARTGLADRDPAVVLVAIEVLGVVGDATSAVELEPLAAEHADPKVREAAAETLAILR